MMDYERAKREVSSQLTFPHVLANNKDCGLKDGGTMRSEALSQSNLNLFPLLCGSTSGLAPLEVLDRKNLKKFFLLR
jgi:hypothetical protein